MRILFISYFFPPEEPPAAFLAFEFAKAISEAGHDVDVLTGFPNWPTGCAFPLYSSRRMTIETIKGITVCCLPFLAAPTGWFAR